MILIDTRPTFLDAVGNRLALGRLVIYKQGSTTLANAFSDSEMTVPTANPVPLTDAGWTANTIYVDESVTIHAQDAENADVKIFDVSESVGGSVNTDASILVDTMADLALVTPADGLICRVKGYYNAFDCPERIYIFKSSRVSTADGGAIVGSSVQPNGRWLIKNDSDVFGAWIWGMIPGVSSVNSQFRAAQDYCSSANKTLYIPGGTYDLVTGGTYTSFCNIRTEKNTLVICSGGSYTWTITGSKSIIVEKLAGAGVTLIVGGGCVNTVIPLEAFYNGIGLDRCSPFILRAIGSASATIANTISLTELQLESNPSFTSSVAWSIGRITGSGSATFNGTAPDVKMLRLSLAASSSRERLLASCTGIAIVDVATYVSNNITSCAHIHGEGANSNGTITKAITVASGKTLTIKGPYSGLGVFAGGVVKLDNGQEWNAECFNTGAFAGSFNASSNSSTSVDLLGRTVGAISRADAKISNGTIAFFTSSSITLTDVIVVNASSCSSVFATRCAFHGGFSASAGSVLLDCSVASATGWSNAHLVGASTWKNVSVSAGDVKVVGGNALFDNVSIAGTAYFAANSTPLLSKFRWVGGSANRITIDATKCAVTSTVQDVKDFRIIGLDFVTEDIEVVDSDTHQLNYGYWTNVNEGVEIRVSGCRSTAGRALFAMSEDTARPKPSGSAYWFADVTNKILVLNRRGGRMTRAFSQVFSSGIGGDYFGGTSVVAPVMSENLSGIYLFVIEDTAMRSPAWSSGTTIYAAIDWNVYA